MKLMRNKKLIEGKLSRKTNNAVINIDVIINVQRSIAKID